ncbi:hypothetical protein QE152_g31364 [Popillia japonica]|uniref:Uncharacterized protein n=1 Tax=Popillia japonica TaxID=7064 RepID=A0AAW1J2J6_POPJA
MPLVLVNISKDHKNIYHLKEVLSLDITVETLNCRPTVGQCFRCQWFGHAQTNKGDSLTWTLSGDDFLSTAPTGAGLRYAQSARPRAAAYPEATRVFSGRNTKYPF